MMRVRRLRPVGEPAPFPSLRAWGRGDAPPAGALACLQFPGWSAQGFASGTAALAAAILHAIAHSGVRQPRVIIPAYACPDVAAAAVFAGAQIDLADALPDSPWVDPAAVSALLTPDTVALVYMRFLGMAANDVALRAALNGSDALLIEDSAHTFPRNGLVESDADLVALSFGRGKPIPLRKGGVLLQRQERAGSGDASTAPSPADSVLQRFAHWRRCAAYNVGIQPNMYWLLTQLGGLRVDAIRWRELQSLDGMPKAICELLPAAVKHYRLQSGRQQERLTSALQGSSGPWTDLARTTQAMSEMEGISSVRGAVRLWRHPLLFRSERDRDRAFEQLWDQGLGASRLYNGTLAALPGVSTFVRLGATGNAADFARRLLALPLHSAVRDEDFTRMVGTLSNLHTRSEKLTLERA